MAMIQCGECGKEVSDKAVSCPNCGAPVAEPKVRENVREKVRESVQEKVRENYQEKVVVQEVVIRNRLSYEFEKLFTFLFINWSIFVLMFFNAWFIPNQIRKYFGLSIEDDYSKYMGVVGLLVVIVILIFRKRLAGLIGQIIAAILIAGAIWGPDILAPEERAVKQARDEFKPLLHAALKVGCWERLEWMEEKGAIFDKDDMIEQCDADEARFVELAESSSDIMVAKLCNPRFGGSARNSPVVDDFCKSRSL